ncbi:MAG TPA: hypothetical protein PKY81_13335 [bacterium]|nr:hypothetical protein [bacterium]HPN31931.1 hypothetical protein [bacterium]
MKMKFQISDFLKISPKTDCLPVIFGDGIFSEITNSVLLDTKYDAVALPLPASLKSAYSEAVKLLPEIYCAGYCESSGDRFGYAVSSPCNAAAMAVKICIEEKIPFFFIDYDAEPFVENDIDFPDSYALRGCDLNKFYAVTSLKSLDLKKYPHLQNRADYMAHQIHILELDFKKILFIPSIHYWIYVKDSYLNLHKPPVFSDQLNDFSFSDAGSLFAIDKNSLSFVLGELPYAEYVFEKNRSALLDGRFRFPDFIKELLIETRNKYNSKFNLVSSKTTLKSYNILLKYIRNLTLIRNRLTPDLYTIITAAKQTINDNFAIELAETAKLYGYADERQESDNIYNETQSLKFNIGCVMFETGEKLKSFNRLDGRKFFWQNVKLKKKPLSREKQKKYKMLWNPNTVCSWPPEDVKIENFNNYVRNYAKSVLNDNHFKSEKFSTSFKDGLDMRETLKNWHKNEIYVKEIPNVRGSVDTVLIFFEYPLDHEKYNWKCTLWAEHDKESTLSVIATDYKDCIIGPGIGRMQYGAIAMWYPPRFFKDIWGDPLFHKYSAAEHRIAAGALHYSNEKYCVIISPEKPDLVLRQLAKQFKRKWIYIPLSKFSGKTIEKLREAHILNGHKVRTYAANYII